MGLPMMPRPMKPTFMTSSRGSGLGAGAQETIASTRGRLRCGRPVVLEPIQPWYPRRSIAFQQEAVVDFARAGFVARGRIGDLHVRDPRQVALDRLGEVAFHDLHVIDVVLQEQVVGSRPRR